MEATEDSTGRGGENEDAGGAEPESFRPPETLQETRSTETTRQKGEVPDYMGEQALAYLAYILKEAELIRARTEMIRRNTTLIIVLLALAVIVLIIVWLDITGAIRFI